MSCPRTRARLFFLLLIAGAIITGSLSLPAQDPPPPPPVEEQASEEQKVDKKEDKKPPVKVGVELRWRGEFRDNFDLQTTEDADYFTGQRIRFNLTFNLHKKLQFYFQPQDTWLYGAERDKIIHDFNTNVHQAYFDWKITERGAADWGLRIGRQEFNYGRQRLVGGFGWDNVSRSFDGARLRHQKNSWTTDVLWGRLEEIRRRGSRFRPGNLDISGVHVTRTPKDKKGRTELYGFFLRDSLRSGGELGAVPATTELITVGFRRLFEPATGFRYELENAWQFGDRGPDSHRAAVFVANGGYVWDAPLKPSLKLEYAYASGDNNPADGKSREFHNLFPTNHLHYGYSDLEGLRNLHNIRVTGAAQLHKKVRFEVDFHKFLLAAKRGAWKNAGGAVLGVDPAGLSGRDVGQEVDFTLRLPLGKHLSLMGGYAFFRPGTFAELTRGPETHQWGFLQTVIRF